MINNKWLTTESLPPSGVEVFAKVKGHGICRMMIISIEESSNKCSFNPGLWQTQHEFTWCQVDNDFVCSQKLIEGWQPIDSTMTKIK